MKLGSFVQVTDLPPYFKEANKYIDKIGQIYEIRNQFLYVVFEDNTHFAFLENELKLIK